MYFLLIPYIYVIFIYYIHRLYLHAIFVPYIFTLYAYVIFILFVYLLLGLVCFNPFSRACLIATVRSSGASQSTIKLVATNLIANGKLSGSMILFLLLGLC